MKKIAILMYTLIFSIMLVGLSGCSTSTIAVDKSEMAKVTTIAITHFQHSAGVPRSIATECENAFKGHFITIGKKVLERAKLRRLLKEVEINQSGLVDNPEELGRLSGAQALLFGTVTAYKQDVRRVEYWEYKKNKLTGKRYKIKKRKRKKFFTFQLQVRLVSTLSGDTILTLKNSYPERSYEMTSSMTLVRFRENILNRMGIDLKKAIED